MKMNLKKIAVSAIMLGALLGTSSCKFLESDAYIEQVNHLNDTWSSRKDIRSAWAACYGFIPNYTDMATSWPFSGAGDEGYAGNDSYNALKLAQGKVDPNLIPGGMNYWTQLYKAIRVCNTFLVRSNEANDLLLVEGEIASYQADVRFLRAYYYSTLLELYGPFVIVDKVIDYASGDMPTTRATLDECVKFINADLDEAIKILPDQDKILSSDNGRPSKAAAMAVKARVLLWAASPLVNGNNDYTSFKTMDGKPFFNSDFKVDKWNEAANAYKAIIDLNKYELFTKKANDGYNTVPLGDFPGNNLAWPDGPAGIDPYRSYKGLFCGDKDYWNKEAIWQVNLPGQVYALTMLGWPRGHKSNSNSDQANISRICASQEIVDAFFMNNGNTIDQESSKLYNDMGMAKGSDSRYVLGNGASKASPINTNYVAGNGIPVPPSRVLNREARFYATIGFQGRGYLQDDKATPVYYGDYRAETVDGYFAGERPTTRTCYPIVKWVHDEDNKAGGNFEKQFPVIRLAEVYLSYAEALNEYAPGNPDILKYLNMVRFRAGLPGYATADQATMRDRIKHERFVEFGFEGGKRYFDSRRWKDADNSQHDAWGNTLGLGGSIYGCNYLAMNISYYDRTIIDGYIFRKRDYFYPITYDEVANHWGELVQNPGW